MTTIKVRCTSKKEVFMPGSVCHVYEFFVLGAHDGGAAEFPNGQAMFTVTGTKTRFYLGKDYDLVLTDVGEITEG